MNIVTHDERFHADDVFSTALMQIIFGDDANVKRSRDAKVIENADIVYDVGGIYDEEKNRFDHHQQGGSGERDNGIPYAAFGLVWKKWGEELCGSKQAADIVDKKLVQVIDARDNGFQTHEKKHEDYTSYSIDTMIKSFVPSWKEEERYDERFFNAVNFVRPILEREIELVKHKMEAIPLVEKAYSDAEDKRVIILDRFIPWAEVLNKYEEPAFVIAPDLLSGKWKMVAVQEEGFVNRIDPPMEWRGLYDEDLQKVTGVSDAVFCHRSGFLCVAGSREGIMKMLDIILKN
jgi:uncharacterized UPF0160 family protein